MTLKAQNSESAPSSYCISKPHKQEAVFLSKPSLSQEFQASNPIHHLCSKPGRSDIVSQHLTQALNSELERKHISPQDGLKCSSSLEPC